MIIVIIFIIIIINCYLSHYKIQIFQCFVKWSGLWIQQMERIFNSIYPIVIPLLDCVEKSMLTIRWFMWWYSCLRWRRSTFSMMRLIFFITSLYTYKKMNAECMFPSINFLFHQFISSSSDAMLSSSASIIPFP